MKIAFLLCIFGFHDYQFACWPVYKARKYSIGYKCNRCGRWRQDRKIIPFEKD
jgi:hypothetical protein